MTSQLIMEDVFDKKIEIEFTEKNTSSDSGLVLFKPIISKLGIVDDITKLLHDPRNPLLITHHYSELVEQKLSMMIAGYNDLNDSDFLRKDHIFKLLCKGTKSPVDLASTSTLFRLEDHVSLSEDKKLVELQVRLYLKRNRKRFKKEMKKKGFITISLDLDPTDIEVFGQQEFSFYNGYYKEKCYLPMVISDGTNDDLICGYLRPGTKHACWCLESVLHRMFNIIEEEYPGAHYHLRADSGFQRDSFFNFLERKDNLIYEIALSKNKSLLKMLEDGYNGADITFDEEKNILKLFKEFGYKADSWTIFRRICCKVEINRHGNDHRFIVTNGKMEPKETVDDYNQRANVENRIKELKSQSGGDRLSAEDFSSNFFRFNIACYTLIIFQEFKKKLSGTKFEKNYVSIIREKFIKVAGIIKVSTRRVLIKLSKHYPYQKYWPALV